MDDDRIDWRSLATRLRAGWPLLALACAVALVASLAVDLARGERYVSEAMLAVTKPVVVAQFDPRLASRQLDPSFPYQVVTLRAYAELAATEATARDVANRLGLDEADAPDLLRRITVRALAEGSLLAIRARARSPHDAAHLANAWAQALVDTTGRVFGGRRSDEQVLAQRDEAGAALTAARERLAGFHATSRLPATRIELERAGRAYAEALELDDRLASVLRDIETLRAQAEPGSPIETGDALAAIALQLRTLSAGPTLPAELQLSTDRLSATLDTGALDTLARSTGDARQRLAPHLEAFPARLAGARAGVERLEAEQSALELERDLALERYTALARKADELALSRAASGTELQLAAAAAAPVDPDWATPLRRAALAAGLAALAAGLLVLLRPERAPSHASPPRALP